MMRPVQSNRRRLSLEFLETRALMSGSTIGPVPGTVALPSAEIFVKFSTTDPLADQQAELASLGATVVTSYADGPELVRLGRGVVGSSAVARLQSDPEVAYATLDSTIHTESVPFYPTDPAFGQDWGLNNANNVDIDAPEAYGVTIGSSSTIVAVIDTGIDLSNPDFAGKIWTNPGNDAAAGYPNDVHGWNFVSNSNNVQDDDGHGTHVSAIIGAEGDNSYGTIGVAPAVQIMPLKFLDANGNGSTDSAVSAIYFAVNHGAKVINASWGGVDYYGPLNDAIAYAASHGVVFVTAAGNDGTNNDTTPSYPASFRQPNEISVAAVDRNGALASFSNYGASTVDLAAPGVDIISDVPKSIDPSGLQSLSGTSMSTAYVSGVAALVAGLNPSFNATQIVQRIDSTTKLLPSLAGKTISGGMVDAYNAVTNSGAAGPVTPPAGIPTLIPDGTSQVNLHAVVLASDEFFVAHGSSSIGFIAGLYESGLGRVPSLDELGGWVQAYNSGTVTRFQIAQAFLTSTEGRLDEVARWYSIDLGRTAPLDTLEADPGVQVWANMLLEGIGDNSVEAEIMSSLEYLQKYGASPPTVVQGYYIDLTGRTADSYGESVWANMLWQGFAPYVVLRSFQASPEVSDTKVATWFIEDLGRATPLDQLKADPSVQSLASMLGNF